MFFCCLGKCTFHPQQTQHCCFSHTLSSCMQACVVSDPSPNACMNMRAHAFRCSVTHLWHSESTCECVADSLLISTERTGGLEACVTHVILSGGAASHNRSV
jgi:hypothetical protein